MKKYLIFGLITGLILPYITFAYDLSTKDITLVEGATAKIEKIIEKRGESVRNRIISLLQRGLKQYANNPRMIAILEKTIENINRNELSLESFFGKENLNEKEGDSGVYKEVPSKYFQDVFTETISRENFKDTVIQTISISELGENGKNLVIGGIIKEGEITAKIMDINGDDVMVSIENVQNPFYRKKLVVGLSGAFEGNIVTIKKLTDNEVIIEVQNKVNPFYGKQIKEGMEGTMPDGSKIKIIKIGIENFTISVQNKKTESLSNEKSTNDLSYSEMQKATPRLVRRTVNSIELEWDKIPGAVAYVVKYSNTSVANSSDQYAQYGNETIRTTDNNIKITELSLSHEGLVSNIPYYFAVIAIDKYGNESEAFSDELMVSGK